MNHPILRAILDNQILLFLVLFAPCFLLLRRVPSRVAHRIYSLCGLLSVALFVLLSLLCLARSPFYWHDEPSILSNAAAYMHGQPLYLPPTAPAIYSLLYGPYTYLVYIPFFTLFHHPLGAIKLCILVFNLVNLALFYRILRLYLSPSAALGLLPIAISLLLDFASFVFGLHADRWILFCCCAALLCSLLRYRGRGGWLPPALAVGFLCGLSINFKLTVIPVVFVLLVILYRRSGLRSALAAALLALVTCGAPFLLPGISLHDYLVWVNLSRLYGIIRPVLLGNLLVAAFMLAPGLLLFAAVAPARRWKSYGIVLPLACVLAFASSILTGSKVGAGPWHLRPMLPFLLLWAAYCAAEAGVDSSAAPESSAPTSIHATQRARAVLAAIAIATTVLTMRYAYRALPMVHPRGPGVAPIEQQGAETEIATLLHRYPTQNLAMGYGQFDDDYRSNLRYLLPLHGQQLFLDENGIIEGLFDGVHIPPGLVDRVLGCTDLWLIPHGETPFSTRVPGAEPEEDSGFLFPGSIRLHFTQTHTLLENGEFYDVWGCARMNSVSQPGTMHGGLQAVVGLGRRVAAAGSAAGALAQAPGKHQFEGNQS